MTYDEFYDSTSKIIEFYGEKGRLNPYQASVWFEELEHYSADKLNRALKNIFKTSQYAPTLSKVLEAIKTLKTDKADNDVTDCKLCHGTGYMLRPKIVNGISYEYAYQCNCQNAIGLDYDGTKIADKEHRSEFYLKKATDEYQK